MSASKCYLKCVNNSHEPFLLEDGVEITLGRGPQTKIKDSRCSRIQVKLKANYCKQNVKVTQVGRNACGLNGVALKLNSTVKACHGDKIEILLGQFVHILEFETTSDPHDKKTGVEKRKNTSDSMINEILENEVNSTLSGPATKKIRVDVSGPWESVADGQLLVYSPEGLKPSNLIAGYDLDGTIIGTMSGAVFPKHKDDWKILNNKILDKLKEFHDKSYKIIFFTNQAGLSSGKQTVSDFKKKIENIVKKIDLPIQVFIATGSSIYRKPCTGMWAAAMERNSNLKIDMNKSFYCGDAAGRDAGGYLSKKDFSQADYLFARNLELNFETPEQHFFNKQILPLTVKVFDPKTIPCDLPLCEPSWGVVISHRLDVVILVGMPASGKTHFAKTHLIPNGYVHINRDTLGTWEKCASVMNKALQARQSVVIDNTNPDVASRKRFIDIGKEYTTSVRCFIMKTNLRHVKHNNKFRQLTDPSKAVSEVVIHTYNKKYQEPSPEEGFSEILKINFWLTFKNPEHEKLYKLFLLEK